MRNKVKLALFFIIVISLLGGFIIKRDALTASAGTDPAENRYKYYMSIEIQKDDSLWGIAKQYRTSEYSTIDEYVKEVKQINHLVSDLIYEGAYLCIPYYSSELN